ncbi:MAG: protein kinase [Terriglobales bacterium]
MSTPVVPRNLAGRYDIKEVLGQGDAGVVYRAYDTVAGTDVAFKLLNTFPEGVTLQLFKKDCAILSLVKHPNILDILDIGEFEEGGAKKLYFVMPLLAGASLQTLMQTASHRLTVERTVRIISDSCKALQTAHERDLVHGDLKPSNIFLTDDESVKVSDFGISRLGIVSADNKRSPFYLSPEQAQNKPLSPASDIFSLSVICYEALTGRQAFRRTKEEEVIAAILTRTPPLASELNSQVNETIARVLRAAMAKQPGDRFASAADFGNALDKALRNEPVEVVDPPETHRSRTFEPEIRVRVKEEANTSLAFDNFFRSFDKSGTDPRVAGPTPAPEIKSPTNPPAQPDIPTPPPSSPGLSLTREGQRLCSRKQFVEGLKLLRRARQLDPNDAAASLALCDGLIEEARSIVDNDWKSAEELVQEALELNPGHAGARSMRTVVLERKKQHAIDQCLLQAVSMQAAGNLAGALARVEETLSTYMHDARLTQMRDGLQKELQAQRQQRAREVEVKPVTSPPRAAVEPPALVEPHAAAELPIVAEPPESPSATRLFTSAAEPAMPVPPPPAASSPLIPPLESSRGVAEPARPGRRTTTRVVRANAPGQAPVVRPSNASSPALAFLGSLPKNAVAIGAAALVVVLIAAIAVVKMTHHPRPQPAAVSALAFHVHTLPAGATIVVNGETRGVSDLDLNLSPGNYQIEARLDGYEPATTTIDAQTGTPSAIELTLQPMPPAVKVVSDISNGKVAMDDQPAADLEGSQWSSQSLGAGDHKLTFTAPSSQVSFAFSTEAAGQPSVKSAVDARGVDAVVVASNGTQLHVTSSAANTKLSVDGQPDVDLGKDGADVSGVAAGSHQLAMKLGGDQHTLDLEMKPNPTLTVFILSNQNIGSLLLVTEDNAQVYLDNQLQKHNTHGGQLLITNLKPRDYRVRVAKKGFQNAPEQRVSVHKGEQARLSFTLQAVPHVASLVIQNGTPGMAVLLDNTAIGTVGPDGTFGFNTVSPGDHTLELHKDGFKPKSLKEHFADGGTITLNSTDATLEASGAQLKIVFSPSDSNVVLARAKESPIKVTSGTPMSLAPGSYELTVHNGSFSRSVSIDVTAGQSRTIGPLSLAPGGMQDFEDAAGWKANNEWFVHKGGKFVLFKTVPTSGTFIFSALLDKGHRLQWIFHYTDEKNYELFQMDENNFYRSLVHDGDTTEAVKVPFKTEKKKPRTFQVIVTGNRIVHQIQQGSAWVTLDSWNQPGETLSNGNFGFFLPGNDEIELSNFGFYPELKLR